MSNIGVTYVSEDGHLRIKFELDLPETEGVKDEGKKLYKEGLETLMTPLVQEYGHFLAGMVTVAYVNVNTAEDISNFASKKLREIHKFARAKLNRLERNLRK